MLFLNILPQELKQQIKYLRVSQLLGNALAFVSAIFVIFSLFLLYSNFILSDNLKIRQASINKISQEGNFNSGFVDVFNMVNKISKVQSDFFKPSIIVSDIINMSSSNISFSDLSIDKKTNKITISGTAQTRDDLLNFKNKLSTSKKYSDINFPLENLLSKDKINFNISFNINSYEY